MAQPPVPSNQAPTTEDAFIADRQMFWSSFTGFTTYAVIAVVVLLVLMLVFLVF